MDHHSIITYGTEEVSDITGISAYTIRYYDKCGFFPNLIRGSRRVRSFSDEDINRLKVIDALRKSGLSIEGIKYYVRLEHDSESAEELTSILLNQKRMLELQREEIDDLITVLQATMDGMKDDSN